jgi:hypothetical protein
MREMTLPQTTHAQPIAANARCAACSAALAPDQLFCLSCGTRRRDARIAFRDVLATEAAPVVPVSGSGGWPPNGGVVALTGEQPMPPGAAGRITYMPFLATLALLIFALGVGVWVGRTPVQSAVAPAYAAPVAAAAATTPAATTPADDAAATDASSKDDAKDTAADDAAAAPVKDDTSSLKNLEQLSPDDYQKQAQKLPSEVGTGGTAPPKDDKPAGGGSGFEDFQ